MTGLKFGLLTVLGETQRDDRRRRVWKCRCDCGVTCDVLGAYIRSGDRRSCGCLARHNNLQHGHAMKGDRSSVTYYAWVNMRNRCERPTTPYYHRYGGRGIRVCERWGTFANFLADTGEKPPGMTLDRIDNDRGYEPGNVRWATPAEQAQKRRTSAITAEQVIEVRRRVANGEPQATVARHIGVSTNVVNSVVKRKTWSNIP